MVKLISMMKKNHTMLQNHILSLSEHIKVIQSKLIKNYNWTKLKTVFYSGTESRNVFDDDDQMSQDSKKVTKLNLKKNIKVDNRKQQISIENLSTDLGNSRHKQNPFEKNLHLLNEPNKGLRNSCLKGSP